MKIPKYICYRPKRNSLGDVELRPPKAGDAYMHDVGRDVSIAAIHFAPSLHRVIVERVYPEFLVFPCGSREGHPLGDKSGTVYPDD